MKSISKHFLGSVAVILFMILYGFGGCGDIAINPLIFDGSPVSAVINIDTSDSTYVGIANIDLDEIFERGSEVVDSSSIYNITLQVVDLESPSSDTEFAGNLVVNDVEIVSFDGLSLGQFSEETSVFTDEIQDRIVNFQEGVAYLEELVNQERPLPMVTVVATGAAPYGPLKFTLVFTVYTQLYTTP